MENIKLKKFVLLTMFFNHREQYAFFQMFSICSRANFSKGRGGGGVGTLFFSTDPKCLWHFLVILTCVFKYMDNRSKLILYIAKTVIVENHVDKTYQFNLVFLCKIPD